MITIHNLLPWCCLSCLVFWFLVFWFRALMPCHTLGPPKSPLTMRTGNWNTHSAHRTTGPNTHNCTWLYPGIYQNCAGNHHNKIYHLMQYYLLISLLYIPYASPVCFAPIHTILPHLYKSSLITPNLITPTKLYSIRGTTLGSHPNSNCLGR